MHRAEQRIATHEVQIAAQLFDAAEAAATLALRDGKPEALGFYLDNRRVHVGDLSTLTEQVFVAWQLDRCKGVGLDHAPPTGDFVGQLNQRARAHRLAHTPPATDAEAVDTKNRYSV